MLDEGTCGTIEELARRERVNRGYISRVLRLTLLAPDIVEAILDGRQPGGMRLEMLLEGFHVDWEGQREEARLNTISAKASDSAPASRSFAARPLSSNRGLKLAECSGRALSG